MDPGIITELLKRTLDPAQRLEAEKKLEEVRKDVVGFVYIHEP